MEHRNLRLTRRLLMTEPGVSGRRWQTTGIHSNFERRMRALERTTTSSFLLHAQFAEAIYLSHGAGPVFPRPKYWETGLFETVRCLLHRRSPRRTTRYGREIGGSSRTLRLRVPGRPKRREGGPTNDMVRRGPQRTKHK